MKFKILFYCFLSVTCLQYINASQHSEDIDDLIPSKNTISRIINEDEEIVSVYFNENNILLKKLEEKEVVLEEKKQLITILMDDKKITQETLSFYSQTLKEKNDQLTLRELMFEKMEIENKNNRLAILSFEDKSLQDKEEIKKLQRENILLESQLKSMEQWKEKLALYDEYSVVRLGQGSGTQSLRIAFAAEPWLLTPNQRYAIANHRGDENTGGGKSLNTTKKGSAVEFLLKDNFK